MVSVKIGTEVDWSKLTILLGRWREVERADEDVSDVVIVELVNVLWLRNILRVESSFPDEQQNTCANQR